MSKVYIKKNSNFSEVKNFFIKTNGVWSSITQEQFLTYLRQTVSVFGGEITSARFEIAAPSTVAAETCQCLALYNDAALSTGVVWSVVSGSTYGSIDNTGLLTINSTANESEIVITATYGGKVATHTLTATYRSGSTSETTTEVIVDESGNSTTTITTVTENEDGSSYVEESVVIMDESGNTIGSSESTTNNNADGSYEISTVQYDENGDATSGTNVSGDTSGNVSTQDITYNANGEPVITGYEIDTTGSEGAGKDITGDGVNTEFVPFADDNCGFVMHIVFESVGEDQPNPPIVEDTEDTGTNWLYNVMSAKATTPVDGKYPGFDIRWAINKNTFTVTSFQFRYAQQNASNTIKALTGRTADGSGTGHTYDIIVTYDPELVLPTSRTTFSATSPNGCMTSVGANVTFPSNNIDFTLGYALNMQGEPYRYANVKILEFTIDKICSAQVVVPDEPVISCDGETVTITCATPYAIIRYRLGTTGNYLTYSGPISITADTTVYAYSELMGQTSDIVSEYCTYDNGVADPVIDCDGMHVTITCATVGSVIYYKINDDVAYTQYSTPITITADTTVWAYAVSEGVSSTTVSQLCVYDDYHDYSQDYLTFDVLTNGTIKWNSLGSGQAKTIEYSKNNGAWTSITASTATTISVVTGDKVRFRGTNTTYAKDKNNYSGFEGGTANFNIEGNIMSLVYGDNFANNYTLPNSTYAFCSIFKKSNVVSAENLILPATTLTQYCYRAMFSYATLLTKAPTLPATTLAKGCYWYMFEQTAISTAPDLNATTLVAEAYGNMFNGCANLNYIKCLATTGFSTTNVLQSWVSGVSATGTFVKDENTTWSVGVSGIPIGWVIVNEGQTIVEDPVVSCDGTEISISCDTTGADIYYRLNHEGTYTAYVSPISITASTFVETFAELDGVSSVTVSQNCEYLSTIPLEYSNRALGAWNYNNQEVETPYSVNAIDGHSSSMAKGTFNFETSFVLRQAQPTYLWFQHADQSATIYVDDVMVEKHWGGYNAFFVDISNYVHAGSNNVKVSLKNNEGSALAPSAGDFNFNATLGNVKLLTSPVLPDIKYGYDGFHVTSDVATSSATVNVETTVASGATLKCIIDDGTFYYSATTVSNGSATTFTTVISNPVLWNGKINPHLYNITLEIYLNGNLYHRFQRGYGLRFFDYAVSGTTMSGETGITYNGSDYTGFLLNGQPYFLRGVCMHDDLAGKANALNAADYAQEFAIIQELGCNFIRLAHYPHPKEVYDWCDQLGIIVQTEVPCVNQLRSTVTQDYYDHLYIQYEDMVRQHYNHPCIIFWGLFNEAQTDDATFAKTTLEGYKDFIKAIDPSRWVGYVTSASASNPSSAFGNPDMDWFGGNIYVGWYSDKTSNNPTSQLNTRVNNIIKNLHKPYAYSEYGCGGTQHCHSENPQSTTTTGNYERHDIEYQMWLHEGHIAAIKNFPQLLFTGQWQLFDIAVTGRNEGYIVCLDGENTSTDDNLRRLNNKGLVERDHVTKKDTFYLYKAWWSNEDFVHICGKDYTKKTGRVIKCYTNDGNSLSLYVNNVLVETVSVTDNIATFTAMNFNSGDIVRVDAATTTDTFTFE